MRLWSLHPKHLDSKGLVALWREGLLAQRVLQGLTTGYRNHPQLRRFRQCSDPLGAIAEYLRVVEEEAVRRNYHFDRSKIASQHFAGRIPVTIGQLEYEHRHLLNKLMMRDLARYHTLQQEAISLHPLFEEVAGEVEEWEVLGN